MASSAQQEQVPPAADYHAKWQAFARRRILALTLLYGWLPLCLLLIFSAELLDNPPEWSIAIMLFWTAGLFAAIWWAGEFRCPRCRRRYGALGRERSVNLTRGLFDKICYNCKLTKFEKSKA
jgi:hypothetical protein